MLGLQIPTTARKFLYSAGRGFQAAYQPIFDNYSWKVKRNDTQQVSSLTYY